jgi:hypothetical protein
LSIVPMRGSDRPPAFDFPFSYSSAASTWHTEYFFCGVQHTCADKKHAGKGVVWLDSYCWLQLLLLL